MQIAIMGCIVNGPGEMADADFGYVGGAPGKIDLYVGKVPLSTHLFIFQVLVFESLINICVVWCGVQTVVQRGIAMEGATEALIQLIKDHGRWVDPPAQE